MKVLFIGGTGTISMAITKRLLEEGHKVYLLNRGTRNGELPAGRIGLTGILRMRSRYASSQRV